MWKPTAVLLAVCSLAFAADNWEKVKDLKVGSDIRIFKTNGLDPTAAKFAGLTDTKLVVVIKNVEVGIDKTAIERIDYQPPAEKPVVERKLEGDADSLSFSVHKSTTRDGWRNVYQR